MSYYLFVAGFFALVLVVGLGFCAAVAAHRHRAARRQAHRLFPHDEQGRQAVEGIWFWAGPQARAASWLYARKRRRDGHEG